MMKPLMARLALLAFLAAPVLASAATPAVLRFDAGQLQSAARAGFPLEESLLEGFASLTLSDPDISIPQPGERVHLQMNYDIALATGERLEYGNVVVSSGLRYDPGTRGLHLDQPEIVSVDVPALGGAMNDSARTLLNGWLLDYAREEPVYRLDDSTVGRMASRRIERVDIDPGVITIRLD